MSETKTEEWQSFVRELGHRLAGARVAKGLSQAELAESAGLSTGACQRLESKHREPANPVLSTLVGVCRALEIGIDELIPDRWPHATGRRVQAD